MPSGTFKPCLKPSRYLITSGNYEPVLDSGARNSIFAKILLNLLRYPDSDYISATELGLTLRQKVGKMTGQMVRSGPANVPSHAGGEFVFITTPQAKQRLLASTDYRKNLANPTQHPDRFDDTETTKRIQDIALLHDRGAYRSANQLMNQTKQKTSNPEIVDEWADMFATGSNQSHETALLWGIY